MNKRKTEQERKGADYFWERYAKFAGNDAQILNKTGIGQSTLSTWKTKKRFPGADDAVKIAAALKTTVEYLVTGEENPGFSHDERELLDAFNLLDGSGKRAAIASVNGLLGVFSAKNSNLADSKVAKTRNNGTDAKSHGYVSEPQPVYGVANEPKTMQSIPLHEEIIDNVVFHDWRVIEIPLVGSTAAGQPINFEDINPDPPTRPWAASLIHGNPGEYYCVLIEGTSMTEADIKDGDYALIKHVERPENGEIMLVRHDNSSTLKRIKIIESAHGVKEVYLCWEDGSNHRVKVENADYEIQGKLAGIQRKPGKR